MKHADDLASTLIKDAPPLAVGGIMLFGVELSNWVLILTAIYTIIRIIGEVTSWYESRKNKREQSNRAGTR